MADLAIWDRRTGLAEGFAPSITSACGDGFGNRPTVHVDVRSIGGTLSIIHFRHSKV
jgi:hypothetical protein